MDKKKFEIIVLVILLAGMVNYTLFSYFVQPQTVELKSAEQNYNSLKAQVRELRFKEKDFGSVKDRVDEKLKAVSNSSTSGKLQDNQSLIREFYEACKKYGVKGESMTFNLQGAINSSEGSATAENNGGGTAGDILVNTKTQIITLTFSGEKVKVESFLENIRSVSARRLLVSSIDITTASNAGVSIDKGGNSTEEVSAQVILTEFLYSDNSEEN